MKLLLLPGSLRKESFNKKLLSALELSLKTQHSVQLIDLKAFALPVYDGDIEASGFPETLLMLSQNIMSSEAVVISSPEYNASISSPLKNVLDWVSRTKPQPFQKKPVLLLSASPGALGGVRGLLHARVPLDSLGAYVFPQTFGLAKAHDAFAEDGTLKDAKTQERLQVLIKDFTAFADSFRKQN